MTSKERYKDNPEPYKAAQRRYRETHKTEIQAYKKELYQQRKNDPAFQSEQRRRWRQWYSTHRVSEAVKGALKHVRLKYGLTTTEAAALIERRSAGCQVCGSKVRPAIDHCHTSGRIRGILCQDCNMAIGRAKDDPKILDDLAAYLRTQST